MYYKSDLPQARNLAYGFFVERILCKDKTRRKKMKLNGTEIQLKENKNLEQFLLDQGFCLEKIAIEKNGTIIPRAKRSEEQITNEDVIEVVRFVGGG